MIDLLTLNLRKAGFTLSTATDGAAGLRKAREESPALIILDLMLPKMPGLEICKVLKTDIATRQIPIIMLTAKAEEIDRIVGLEFGADDYVTKPFSPRELVLRVNAILRRGKGEVAEEKKLSIGPITLDPARHHVAVAGKPVRLTSVEFKLLSMLMQRQGRVQARDRLLNEVWGYESDRHSHGRYARAPVAQKTRQSRRGHRDGARFRLSHPGKLNAHGLACLLRAYRGCAGDGARRLAQMDRALERCG